MKLSLVAPCYNEAENVAAFQDAVIGAFDGCGYDYEIVYVDDGSKDATLHNLKKLFQAQKCPVKVVSFSRNFGKEAGIYAGMSHASGEYISLIDADLQQRPEIVREMVKILDAEPETDIVAAYQDRRGEGRILSFLKSREREERTLEGVVPRISAISAEVYSSKTDRVIRDFSFGGSASKSASTPDSSGIYTSSEKTAGSSEGTSKARLLCPAIFIHSL